MNPAGPTIPLADPPSFLQQNHAALMKLILDIPRRQRKPDEYQSR
jgi:hypothetical protein